MKEILLHKITNEVTIFDSELFLHLIRKSGFSLTNRAVVNGQNRFR